MRDKFVNTHLFYCRPIVVDSYSYDMLYHSRRNIRDKDYECDRGISTVRLTVAIVFLIFTARSYA